MKKYEVLIENKHNKTRTVIVNALDKQQAMHKAIKNGAMRVLTVEEKF